MFTQIIILLFVFFAISRAFLRFRDKEITLPSFLFWIMIWLTVTVVTIFPQWASFLASVFGVGRGADLLVYLSVILLFYLIFRLYVRFENLERDLTRLIRQLALKEGEGKLGKSKNPRGLHKK